MTMIIKVLKMLLAKALKVQANRTRNKASLLVTMSEAQAAHAKAQEDALAEKLFNAKAERLAASKRLTKSIMIASERRCTADCLDSDALVVSICGKE